MTKAKRIRELASKTPQPSTRQIAEIIEREFGGQCLPSYVRVCARQRVDGRPSKHDIAYAAALSEKHRTAVAFVDVARKKLDSGHFKKIMSAAKRLQKADRTDDSPNATGA